MKTAAITNIENQLFDLANLDKKIKSEGYLLNPNFNGSNEYSFKDPLKGVKNIFSDLKLLVNNPKTLIRNINSFKKKFTLLQIKFNRDKIFYMQSLAITKQNV